MTYAIRDLQRATDTARLERVQLAAWGFGEREVVPGSLMMVHAHSGGIVAAAYPAGSDEPVGFVFGFNAERGGRRLHHSHMLAVLPEHRGSGLARDLKLHQRRRALDQGHDTMTWTMDPLLALNARLNLGKLGARAVDYLPDWYAERTGIYAGLPADRFMIEWDLGADPAERPPLPLAGPRALEAEGGEVHQGPGDPRLDLEDDIVLVEVPRDIGLVKARDLAVARRWREATRNALGHYLTRGYAATDLSLDGARTYYRLERHP